VAEEAVGGDLELEDVAAPVPRGRVDVPHEDAVLRLGRRERAEVVLSQDDVGGVRKLLLVKGAR
jgi:hypothetical protein